MTTRRFAGRRLGLGLSALLLMLPLAGLAADEHAGVDARALGDRILALDGPVEIGRGEPPVWATATVGATLRPGDALRTGAAARAEAFIRGATVRLYENSLLRIAASPASGVHPAATGGADLGSTLRLGLDQGRALFDVLLGRDTRAVDVETPKVVVSVRGTRFSVDAVAHAVSVFRGQVAVRGLADDVRNAILVRQGFSTRQLDGGRLELISLPVADPWNDWTRNAQYPAAMQAGALRPARERALEGATRAARENAATRVIERVAERDPAILERLKSGSDSTQKVAERERDPILDRKDADVGDSLTSDAVAQLTGSTSLLLDRVTSGGPNLIEVTDSTSGQVISLLESDVQDILNGAAPLPTELETMLGDLNVSPEDFTQAVGLLFGRH
ncbi:MAG: FecR family protein [Myxococcota bacterium]